MFSGCGDGAMCLVTVADGAMCLVAVGMELCV